MNVLDYAPDDHPHHKGVWVSVDEVELHRADGSKLGPFKHWVEAGRIETVAVEAAGESDGEPLDRVAWRYENLWRAPDGTPVLKESTTVAAHADGLLTYDITLAPPAGGGHVEIHDTKEGFLGLRMAEALTVKQGTGRLVNSEGGVGESNVWGKPARWVDYSGTVKDAAGDETAVGVALFDHPANFRPARYHARGYGLLSVSPFGPHAYSDGAEPEAPVTIREPLRLRYALFTHAGDAGRGGVRAAYERYAGGE